MTASLPAVFNVQLLTDTGAPASGFRLYTYSPGTTVHKIAYTDAAATTPHTYTNDDTGGQFIALNSRGELPAGLYLTDGGYDLALKNQAGATVWTRRADGIASSASGLDSYTDASKGAGLVGFSAALSYAANTIGEYLKRIVVDASGKITQSRFEATATDDTGTPDAAVRVNRTLSAGVLDGHGVRDQTTFFRAANSYAAFDAAITSSGNGTNDHIANFQSRPSISRSGGLLTHVYNFISTPTFNSGAVTNNYGLFCANPVGAGTVDYNYGIYVPLQTKGSVANYPIYVTQPGAPSFFGSPLQVNNLFTVNPSVPFMIGALTSLDYPHLGYNYNPQTDNKAINDVAVTCKFDTSGFHVYTKAAGVPAGAGTLATMTEGLRVDIDGNVYGKAGGAAMTNGFHYMPSGAGAAGTPAVQPSGRVPFYYDATANKIGVFTGGVWKWTAALV